MLGVDKYMNEIVTLYFKSIEIFKLWESTPRDFGSGDLLYKSEVHTLAAIGNHPGINHTALSIEMDVSKSAISKFVGKLLDKDLIVKTIEKSNKKEVIFNLTSKGKIVFEGHKSFRKLMFSGIDDLLANLKEEEKEFLIKFLKELNHVAKNSLK